MILEKKNSLFILLAWLSGAIGFFFGLTLDPLWFARFGSLVVLFAAMSEYSLLHGELNRLYDRLEDHNSLKEVEDLTPSKWHKKKVWITHITLIMGTLIWGFGDLLL